MNIRGSERDRQADTGKPVENGFFEITLPKVLFKENPQAVTVKWSP